MTWANRAASPVLLHAVLAAAVRLATRTIDPAVMLLPPLPRSARGSCTTRPEGRGLRSPLDTHAP